MTTPCSSDLLSRCTGFMGKTTPLTSRASIGLDLQGAEAITNGSRRKLAVIQTSTLWRPGNDEQTRVFVPGQIYQNTRAGARRALEGRERNPCSCSCSSSLFLFFLSYLREVEPCRIQCDLAKKKRNQNKQRNPACPIPLIAKQYSDIKQAVAAAAAVVVTVALSVVSPGGRG